MNLGHKNSSNSTVSKNANKPGSVYCSLTIAPILLRYNNLRNIELVVNRVDEQSVTYTTIIKHK